MHFEGIHCFDTASVRFAFYPDGDDGARILGEISEATLRDVWGAPRCDEGLITVCKSNFDAITTRAITRYRADPGHAIVLHPGDFEMLPVGAGAAQTI